MGLEELAEEILEKAPTMQDFQVEETTKKFKATVRSDNTNLSELVRAIEDVVGGDVHFSANHEKENMPYTDPIDIPIMKVWVK